MVSPESFSTCEFNGYRVELEVFEGPLDLLLHLIKREEIDIYDIPIGYITDQYLSYLRHLLGSCESESSLDLDSAGEFLVMASTLLYIKSRMLLPQPSSIPEEEAEDPRAELVEMLSAYRHFKEIATYLRDCEDKRQHLFTRPPDSAPVLNKPSANRVELSLNDLLRAMEGLIQRRQPQVQELHRETFSVTEKIQEIEAALVVDERIPLDLLLPPAPCRLEIIATFLALLELVRQHRASIQQHRLFGTIYICRPYPSEEKVGI
jgi:segregation and condensation protein A